MLAGNPATALKKVNRALKVGVTNFSISADGKKLLLQYAKGKLEITDATDKFEAKPIDLTQLGMTIDPQQEWQQIFDETWWMEKEFFCGSETLVKRAGNLRYRRDIAGTN